MSSVFKMSTVRHRKKYSKKTDRSNDIIRKESEPSNELASVINLKNITIILLALIAGIAHGVHLYNMFENERFFSHLSPLERELSFRTEMGLYYSYYKIIVSSDSFSDGIKQLLYDNMTEYPDTINTFRRLNLLPEVLLSAMYRIFLQLGGENWKDCFQINRGYGQPPVNSCTGLGEPSYFYIFAVFTLNGLMVALFLLLCYHVSGSVMGATFGTLQFFYNHSEATRVQWTPPLRESFAFPFLVLQLLVLSCILSSRRPTLLSAVGLSLSTLCFMLPWQFAQFALLTQILAVFAVYLLRLISMNKFQLIILSLIVSFILNIILQFGNTLLLSSYYASCLLTCLMVVKLTSVYMQRLPWLLASVIQLMVVLSGTVGIKLLAGYMLSIKDDNHIGALLLAKFTTYQDFHTQLYTCAAEFDFLSLETIQNLTNTLLLPFAVFTVCCVIIKAIKKLLSSGSHDQYVTLTVCPVVMCLYHVLQCSAFAVMAFLIMRLKLFLTPQLAILASLSISPKVISFLNKRQWLVVAMTTLCMSSVMGVHNLSDQLSILGEFNAFEQEQLVTWVNNSTPQDAVFAGAMPTMASIKLTTNRPIVNHPHYEDAGIRERTKKVYQIYSRRSPAQVHSTLQQMGVDYIVVEPSWCTRQYRPGCALYELWDYEEPEHIDNPILCDTLSRQVLKPFVELFNNHMYQVLKVKRQ